MVRKGRVQYVGAAHHVMDRGDQRQAIYIVDDDYCFSVVSKPVILSFNGLAVDGQTGDAREMRYRSSLQRDKRRLK
jgi:hypothetical protein